MPPPMMAGTPQNTKIPNFRGTSIVVNLLKSLHLMADFLGLVPGPKIRITISNNYEKSKVKNEKKVPGEKVQGSRLKYLFKHKYRITGVKYQPNVFILSMIWKCPSKAKPRIDILQSIILQFCNSL